MMEDRTRAAAIDFVRSRLTMPQVLVLCDSFKDGHATIAGSEKTAARSLQRKRLGHIEDHGRYQRFVINSAGRRIFE